jgi:hypothetical protein
MHQGQLVFAQLMRHLPLSTFRRCVAHYDGEHKVKSFSCLDQYLCMAFAQLTYRESLRDIQACLRGQSSKLYHLGIRGSIARNTLANAIRHTRLAHLRKFCSAADSPRARLVCERALWGGSGRDRLRARCHDDRSVSVGLSLGTVSFRQSGLSSCIRCSICVARFPALSTSPMASCTMSTYSICSCPGAYYVMDRGYLDFERLHRLHEAGSFFVTRVCAKHPVVSRMNADVASLHGFSGG